MSWRPLVLLLPLALGCGKDDEDTAVPEGDADTDADSDTDADTDTDTDPTTAPWGLEARPANPTCVAPERPPTAGTATLTRVYPSLAFSAATALTRAPGDPDHWYVLVQRGVVQRFDDDPAVKTTQVVLDIDAEVTSGGELGLLGIAFHPDFQTNGQVFLSYTSDDGGLVSRITRYTSPDGGATLDPASRTVILEIEQPYSNHNGGWIEFGPDGYLYAGFGDGGLADDPAERAQDPGELLGKMLRLDVDHPAGGLPYSVPVDNPFAYGGGRPEIYALGLRNPYRWHFDASGQLWVGDVGQDAWEEVDLVERAGNYGWDCREGLVDFEPDNPGCATASMTDPLAVYPHVGPGQASVIGGYVYHGAAIPDLTGIYLYNDFYDGTVYGLYLDPLTAEWTTYPVVSDTGRALGHWAEDEDGELYALDYYQGIWRLDPVSPVASTFPETLSATGCVDPTDPGQPVAGMIPYDLNHPFWSDGADKGRWLAIPDGTTITVGADGDWAFPVGTVLLKAFEKDGAPIETRLMMLHPDGAWGGYSYLWREDGSDADLLDGAAAVALPSQTWGIPSRAECLQCHTGVAGGSLGLETRQLNSVIAYPSTGLRANQLDTLTHLGMFTSPPGDPASLGTFPAIDDPSAPVEDRARAWLHVNCSQCHRPDGPTPVELDLRFDTPLADMGVCGALPLAGDLGLGADARVIVPGDPAVSVLSSRIHRRDAYGMPPTGTALVDAVGADVIDSWITSLVCP